MDNLNTIIGKLSFFQIKNITMMNLNELMQWVELGNKALFNPNGIMATIYILENSYFEIDDSVYRQKRRSFPLQ